MIFYIILSEAQALREVQYREKQFKDKEPFTSSQVPNCSAGISKTMINSTVVQYTIIYKLKTSLELQSANSG